MGTPLTAAKQQLRALMKQRLAGVPQDSVAAQSLAVFETLRDFQPYRDAARVSVFLSMPAAEVQTDAVVRHALACGKQVFVPYLHKPVPGARVMDMVRLGGVVDYESLAPDRWGIPSVDPASVARRQRVLGGGAPDAGAPDAGLATLDLVLVPGVAFDLDDAGAVRRLGHGKGFYDCFLNTYLARTGALPQLYGLALSEQLLSPASGEQVPVGADDRKLHGLILGSGEIKESKMKDVTRLTACTLVSHTSPAGI